VDGAAVHLRRHLKAEPARGVARAVQC